jgi:hypothetical protein
MYADMQVNGARGMRGVVWVGALATLVGVACNPEQRIEESRLRSFGRYGRSVAMSLGIAAVGAPEEDSGHGAVYVLAQGGDVFSPAARIPPPTPGFGHFGDAVAIDGTTLVVGAPRTDRPGAFRAGAVYVFELSANAYTLTATLSSPAPQAWEAFGTAVAIDEDRIVVGAPDRDALGATDAGAAYVFERSGSSWTYVAALSAPSPASSDKHGAAVAVFGDSIAVGAPLRDFAVRTGTNRGLRVRAGIVRLRAHAIARSVRWIGGRRVRPEPRGDRGCGHAAPARRRGGGRRVDWALDRHERGRGVPVRERRGVVVRCADLSVIS